ncbi:DUF6638 family protein [Kiloniella antarctica]|uniref:DUF6638 family protein n=1 Tax=Kiloniella antarctica TaxID=1550907 RepID=A0ABW5BQ38_9PROT
MMRLVERGLMYGNLFEVATPALVERYNEALEKLTGRRTLLSSFHIDLSGFAPEIAEEFEDHSYLNPHGCNRQFILLSVEQKRSPLLNMNFSTSRSILKKFIVENETALFALTSRDAVFGELMNSVYRISNAKHLLDIRQIRIEADTVKRAIAKASELSKLVERFQIEPDGWWNDELASKMINLAKETGDIRRYPVTLKNKSFQQGNFHTTHFDGVYVFRDTQLPVVISKIPKDEFLDFPIETVLNFSNRSLIAAFLEKNKLIQPLIDAEDLDAKDIILQRLDFIMVEHLTSEGITVKDLSRYELRSLALRTEKNLPDEFEGLNDLLRWLEQGGQKPTLSPEHPAYFYSVRAKFHPDRDLVNMLLAELMPQDILQLFICHKEAFYTSYSTWNDAKRNYATDFLSKEYFSDKTKVRRELFGDDSPAALKELHDRNQREAPPKQPWGKYPVPNYSRKKPTPSTRKKTKGPWGGTI